MENQATQYEEISLKEIFAIIRRNWLFLVFTSLIGIVLALALSGVQWFMNPVTYRYQAAVTVNMVNQANFKNQTTTMLHVFSSSQIKTAVMTKLKITSGDYEVVAKESTKPNEFTISVFGPVAENAVKLADEIVTQSRSAVSGAMSLAANDIVENAKITGNPIQVSKRVNFVLNLAIGLILGMMAGFGLLFAILSLRNTVNTVDKAERLLGVKVLAVIPDDRRITGFKKFVTLR